MKNLFMIMLLVGAMFGFGVVHAQPGVSLTPVVQAGSEGGPSVREIERGVFEAETPVGKNVTLRFAPLNVTPEQGIAVLSFDYFCASGMEFMVVTVNNDNSRLEEEMIRMPIAEGWSTFSVDISDKLKRLQGASDYLGLLIVPTSAKPTTIRIKNPCLRAYSEKELSQIAQKAEREAREKRLNTDIDIYLKKQHPCQVSEVKVSESQVEVTGNIHGMPGDVYLCEVPMYGELTDQYFITEQKIEKPAGFKYKFDRYTDVGGEKYDRLYSRWVLAQKSQKGYLICSHGHYADQVNAAYKLPHEVVRSKKGIGGFHFCPQITDADDLQATSSTVNIGLGFIDLVASPNSVPYEYNGKTYYINPKVIEGYDKALQVTASKNMIVSAIILASPARGGGSAAARLMEHPDFDPAGIYTMPNMTTVESLNLYAAAIDYLASRYSRPDQKYGRIHHWIAHNEVDAGWVWTNAGIKTALRFMDIYVKSMRLLYYTARKYNPHAEVLITLTHYWQGRHNEYCYPSAQLLELLLDYTEAEGDFKWGVAHHPYPQSLFEPKSWLDTEATFDYNTPLITFKNLEVLDAWIHHPRALYHGKEKRTLYLSEQNPNSKDYSPEALQDQAAGMAYALKKMGACKGIDAYQMHGWFDQRGEGGLRIGIRRFVDDQTDPAGRKPAWFVFQAFDTPKEEEVFDFAKQIIGITDWDQIIYKGSIAIPSKK